MKRLFMLLVLSMNLQAFAQINFEPGYFISNNGVKTNCLIRNVDWKNNPTSIDYKADAASEIKKKDIGAIKEFGIENASKYVRFSVKIDRSPSDINRLTSNRNPDFENAILFLKVLAEGRANLYKYEDGNLVRYFFSRENQGNPEQLVYKQYISSPGNLGANNYFRQQLTVLKSEAVNQKTLEKLEYKQKDLTSIFLKYNGGNSENTAVGPAKQSTASLNLKVIAGAGFASLKVVDSYQTRDFGQDPLYNAGLEVEYIFPFNKNKWAMFAAPVYQSYKTNNAKIGTVSANNASLNTIEIPVGARHYMFLGKTPKIFLEAGYNASINLGSNYIQKSGFYAQSEGRLDTSTCGNFFIGTGFDYKRYSIGFRYNFKRNPLKHYQYQGADLSTYGITLGFKVL
ncbi:hypothetical protein [Flavobacterium noncentrifugens]|nr:hypothetical protein [Flavobacterium noncentrifugens]